MIQEGVSRHFEYDAGDVLRAFYEDGGAGTEPSTFTHYLYDAGGTRIKKITRKQTGNPQISLYIDGAIDTHYELDGSGNPIQMEQEYHIMDGRARIARRTLYASGYTGTQTPEYKYNLENHLGSSSVTLEANGAIYSLEEYFPFGETSFGSFHKKRYRYCGKERDEESGLYYYGARYYAAWTCRFVNLDPLAGSLVYQSPYCYAGNSPVTLTDVDGLAPEGKTKDGNFFAIDGNGDTYMKRPIEEARLWEKPNEKINFTIGGAWNIKLDGGGADSFQRQIGDLLFKYEKRTSQWGVDLSKATVEYTGNSTFLQIAINGNAYWKGFQDGAGTNILNTVEGIGTATYQYFHDPKKLDESIGKSFSQGWEDFLKRNFLYGYDKGVEYWGGIAQQNAKRDIYDWGHVTGDAAVTGLGVLESGLKIGSSFAITKTVPLAGATSNGGLSVPQLLQKSATLAERAIGGTGRFAGTAKHNYAINLLRRYQNIYGNRGLEFNVYFNNGVGNRGFLDVLHRGSQSIYDFKFGAATWRTGQLLKYQNNFPGFNIQIIRP